MIGAEALVRTLLASGVEACFANPGTSEMHFVAALDRAPGLRCVLGLAETVVTGCADGYGRMAGKPAATLLHCGPGLANGLANLHNARRAHAPIVNIVGDQATYHRPYDAPLTTDTEGLARPVSHWVRTSASVATVASDAAAAVQAARTAPGQIATLVLPADTAWTDGATPAAALAVPERTQVAPDIVRAVALALRRRQPSMLLLSGTALSEAGLRAAHRIAHVTGARLRTPTQVPRMARGRGRVPVDRIPYVVDLALEVFAGLKQLVLVAAKPPVGFFAYPGKPSKLWPEDCALDVLARPEEDAVAALEALADELGAPREVALPAVEPVKENVHGAFEPLAFAHAFAAVIPENAIVVEDAVTSGRALFAPTFGAAPNDWLQNTGGAIGIGLPAATGAAVACPDRKVVCLQADGAGMYTLQALWTQAREALDVITVVFANRVYRILQGELAAVGAKPGPAADRLFGLAPPELDWLKLANGMGVEAARVETLEAFSDVFRAAAARRAPFLIEFRI
ncbi:MAG: acetolactate synthase large subunit [Betaproteobacteria bacterium]|jgi:acetolactate synthase-1/2/3 large subunit|nr:acetolactate synthase large subunit [Betaproteobacteria bacterium]